MSIGNQKGKHSLFYAFLRGLFFIAREEAFLAAAKTPNALSVYSKVQTIFTSISASRARGIRHTKGTQNAAAQLTEEQKTTFAAQVWTDEIAIRKQTQAKKDAESFVQTLTEKMRRHFVELEEARLKTLKAEELAHGTTYQEALQLLKHFYENKPNKELGDLKNSMFYTDSAIRNEIKQMAVVFKKQYEEFDKDTERAAAYFLLARTKEFSSVQFLVTLTYGTMTYNTKSVVATVLQAKKDGITPLSANDIQVLAKGVGVSFEECQNAKLLPAINLVQPKLHYTAKKPTQAEFICNPHPGEQLVSGEMKEFKDFIFAPSVTLREITNLFQSYIDGNYNFFFFNTRSHLKEAKAIVEACAEKKESPDSVDDLMKTIESNASLVTGFRARGFVSRTTYLRQRLYKTVDQVTETILLKSNILLGDNGRIPIAMPVKKK